MPAEEYVANYPRPPYIETVIGAVSVVFDQEVIAKDSHYIRVCETYHPPTIYIDRSAFNEGTLHHAMGRGSFCEWKGVAHYWSVSKADGSDLRERAGWSYPEPSMIFKPLKDMISVYPRLVDACFLEGERVTAQPGLFYGGWITSWTIGPFKGDPNHPELV